VSELQAHSPLGASGAYRWMVCPGSVGHSAGVIDPESEFAALGTAAHALASLCLTSGDEIDAWLLIGEWVYEGEIVGPGPSPEDMPHLEQVIHIDKGMADAVQVYLNAVRYEHPDQNQGNTWVERKFHCPDIHELFYGTADFVHYDEAKSTLHVWDYKHGAGIVVDVFANPQLMYYACGALTDLRLWKVAKRIVLHVAQPRGWHSDGPLREWSITKGELANWLDDVLVPAMDRAQTSTDTASGDHCRFCPARWRACPQLVADEKELTKLMAKMKEKGGAKKLSHKDIARLLDLGEVMKISIKAARENGFARAEGGAKIPGWKLVKARSNREFKETAEKAAIKKFGKDKAFTTPELKSPAKIDTLPGGKKFTTEYAFKPEKGMQLVQASDARNEAGPSTRSMFKPQHNN